MVTEVHLDVSVQKAVKVALLSVQLVLRCGVVLQVTDSVQGVRTYLTTVVSSVTFVAVCGLVARMAVTLIVRVYSVAQKPVNVTVTANATLLRTCLYQLVCLLLMVVW
jgi:hypothetical protein